MAKKDGKSNGTDPRKQGCCSVSLLKYCLLLFNCLFLVSAKIHEESAKVAIVYVMCH
jgi:hypothetical protein